MPVRHDLETRREFDAINVDSRLRGVAVQDGHLRISDVGRLIDEVLRPLDDGILSARRYGQKHEAEREKCIARDLEHGLSQRLLPLDDCRVKRCCGLSSRAAKKGRHSHEIALPARTMWARHATAMTFPLIW